MHLLQEAILKNLWTCVKTTTTIKYLGMYVIHSTQMSCFFLKFYPLILAFINRSCQHQLLLWYSIGNFFYFPQPFYIYSLEFFFMEMLSFFPNISVGSFSYVSINSGIFILFCYVISKNFFAKLRVTQIFF